MQRRNFFLSVAAAMLVPHTLLIAAPRPLTGWRINAETGDYSVTYWYRNKREITTVLGPTGAGIWRMIGVVQDRQRLRAFLDGVEVGPEAGQDLRFAGAAQMAQEVMLDKVNAHQAVERFFQSMSGLFGYGQIADLHIGSSAFRDPSIEYAAGAKSGLVPIIVAARHT